MDGLSEIQVHICMLFCTGVILGPFSCRKNVDWFEKRVMRRILRPMRQEETGGWRNFIITTVHHIL
jgi:hypothetical protein